MMRELGHLVGSARLGLRFERRSKTCASARWTVGDIQWEVAPRAPVQGRCGSREGRAEEEHTCRTSLGGMWGSIGEMTHMSSVSWTPTARSVASEALSTPPAVYTRSSIG